MLSAIGSDANEPSEPGKPAVSREAIGVAPSCCRWWSVLRVLSRQGLHQVDELDTVRSFLKVLMSFKFSLVGAQHTALAIPPTTVTSTLPHEYMSPR